MADGKIIIDVIMDDGSVNKGVANIDKSLSGLSRSGDSASLSIGKIATSIGLVKVAGKAFDVLKSSIGGAVERFDTLQKFPKVMESLGFNTEQSAAASKKLSDGIDGLPTTLQEVVASTQRMTSITGDLDKATDATIAMNNAFLASGASTDAASRGMDQYMKMVSTGKVELDGWTTLQETMPLALQKTAEAMGFVGKTAQNDLYAALKGGTVTFDQFQDKLIELGTGTGQLADLAKKNSLGIGTSFKNLNSAITKGMGNVLTKFDEIIQKLTGKSIAQNIDSLKGIINQTFTAVINSMDKIIPIVEKVKTKFATIAPYIKPLVPVLLSLAAAVLSFIVVTSTMSKVGSAVKSVGAAFSALKATLMANPFAVVIAGIVALVTAFVYFYRTSDTFREKVNNIMNAVKEMSKGLQPAINAMKKLGEAAQIIGQMFKLVFGTLSSLEFGKLHLALLDILPENVVSVIVQGIFMIKKGFEALKGGLSGIGEFFSSLGKSALDSGKSLDIAGVAFNILKSVFLSLLGPIGLVIKAFELIAKSLGGGDVGKGINAILTSFDNLANGIKKNGPQLGKSFGKAIEGILGAVAKALPGIVKGGLQVVAGFIKGVAQGLPTLTVAALELITAFTGALLVLVPTIVLSATAIIVAFLDALTTGLPQIIIAGGKLINSLLQGITEQLPSLIENAATLIVTWLTSLNEHMPDILQAGFDLLISFLKGIADNIGQVTEQAINIVLNFAQAIAERMPDIVNVAVDLIVNFINGLTSRMPDIVTAGVNFIVSIVNGIADNIYKIVDAAGNLIIKFLKGITDKIPDITNAAMDLVDKIVEAIVKVADRMIKAAVKLLNGLADGLDNNRDIVHDAVSRLLVSIAHMFTPDILWDAGAALMDGLKKGLTDGFEKVKTYVGGMADTLAKLKGPIPYDKKVLVNNGKALMYGLEKGLNESFENVKDTVKSMANQLSENMAFDFNVNGNKLALELPTISAESALGIGKRMTTNTNVANYYTTNNNQIEETNEQIIEIHVKANLDKKELTREIAEPIRVAINRKEQTSRRLRGETN